MLRKTLTTAVAAFVATAGTLAVAAPASASDWEHNAFTDESSSIGSSYAGGHLYNYENNDVVRICDNDADGFRVELDVFAGSTYKYHLSASGVGDCSEANASDNYSSHNLPENTTINFYMHLYSADTDEIKGGIERNWYNDY